MITKEETQILKGIAILLVIFEHIGQVLHISVLNPLGPIGVCLFLFVSGYGLSSSYERNGRDSYFHKRIIKVYIPYLVSVGLFTLGSSIIGKHLTGKTVLGFAILKELPQGSFWYLRLMFFWYIIFYFLTYVFDNKKALTVLLCVSTIVITILSGFNRLYVWQFASFPSGIILYKNKYYFDKTPKTIRGWGLPLIILSIVMVLLKKSSYVESHELGVADTLLQIGITWCLSVFLLYAVKYLNSAIYMKKMLLNIGNISYELYLAHAIPLDWVKHKVTITSLAVYSIVVLIITGLLIGVNHLILLFESKKRN